MNILTWNIWYKEDPKNILELLKSTDWDICCLQEVMRGFHPEIDDVAAYLMDSLKAQGHFEVAQCHRDKGWSQGNLILSKLPIANTFSHFVQDQSVEAEPSFSDEGRVVVGIELENTLKILTTHMSYTKRFEETEKRNVESKKLLAYLEATKRPFVVCGDFNAVPTSALVQELTKKYQNLSPDFALPTWTTKPFSHDGFEVGALSYRLDYIFGSREVTPISSHIMQTEYSDHLPVVARIE